jgi:diguanylate cyclase (GGDEF)-like protein
MVDIDRFKEINDKLGHGVGDEALKDAVSILRDSLRRDDFIARYGGDEFIVIIDVDNFKMLEDAVNRIKESAKRFNQEGNKPYKINFSVGYDIYKTFERMSYEEYLAHLDKLMYEDKRVKKISRDN